MFYCDKCADENKWPRGLFLPKSYGQCELCKEVAECTDTPSKYLPKREDANGKQDDC
jgi:hypothetical protein